MSASLPLPRSALSLPLPFSAPLPLPKTLPFPLALAWVAAKFSMATTGPWSTQSCLLYTSPSPRDA
eukprot:687843-Heterocapsa_arctica.AAC.1